MIEPELALALSAREWSDDLRRFLADHGGARVRIAALEPDDLTGESFDVLLIDDICSFLTPRLIERVVRDGRAVIGVCESTEFVDGADRLRRLGVDAVIDAGAHPEQFLEVILRVATSTISSQMAGSDQATAVSRSGAPAPGCRWIAVVGPGGGTGVTEIAIASAAALRASGTSVVVIDGDDRTPSIAQRLGADLFPNVRAAIDALEQRSDTVLATLQARDDLELLVGTPSASEWQDVRPRQLIEVIEELETHFERVVIDLGGLPGARLNGYPIARAVLERSDEILVVAEASPVGVTRLLALLAAIHETGASGRLGIVVNRAPRDPYVRGEVIEEIEKSCSTASFEFIPDDAAVRRAAWNGAMVQRGKFRTGVDRWIARFDSGQEGS